VTALHKTTATDFVSHCNSHGQGVAQWLSWHGLRVAHSLPQTSCCTVAVMDCVLNTACHRLRVAQSATDCVLLRLPQTACYTGSSLGLSDSPKTAASCRADLENSSPNAGPLLQISGALVSCLRQMSSSDVLVRYLRQEPSSAALVACPRQVPPSDNFARCYLQVPSSGALVRCPRQVPSTDALARCPGFISCAEITSQILFVLNFF
jgi:hypothetical protein